MTCRGATRDFAIAAVVLLVSEASPAGAQVLLARSLLSNAVGTASGGGIVVHGSLGQPALGGSANLSNQMCAGYWCRPGFGVVSVDPLPPGSGGDDEPLTFSLGPAMPNPSRGDVRFDLTLPAAGRVKLEAFDAAGRRVGDAFEQSFEAGRMRLAWNGARTRAGVYFIRLSVDGVLRADRRVIVLP
jgi:hypothetical protein